eukprot:TRINITY_DN2785_c0_g1_i2.p1 TRINITY_DN2785_c0_g1~~TRINITY_DN2785_c0_g1_i2.p1  ORF type:complete len:238 (-),score=33.68 TRINITY_DN2785_c0_g1_i2:397-1110(-)
MTGKTRRLHRTRYQRITKEQRRKLFDKIFHQNIKIKTAAQDLNINYSSAKTILHHHRNKLRKNRLPHLPESRRCLTRTLSSKEELKPIEMVISEGGEEIKKVSYENCADILTTKETAPPAEFSETSKLRRRRRRRYLKDMPAKMQVESKRSPTPTESTASAHTDESLRMADKQRIKELETALEAKTRETEQLRLMLFTTLQRVPLDDPVCGAPALMVAGINSMRMLSEEAVRNSFCS